nr:plasmid mobilization relaxosome protein MobC [uncultured Anaerosporobacter sp.]
MADGKRKYCSNKKECKVTFKLSENDYLKLMEDAKEAGVDKSKYLRALVQSGGKIDFTFPKDRTNLIRQITGIATNINQITKVANMMSYVPFQDLRDIRESLLEIQRLLREVLTVWQSQKSCI